MDVLAQSTNAANADGEGVWSRSPDAGINPWGSGARGDGGYQARYSGESALISRNTIAQGRPGRSGWTCGDCRLRFLLQAGRGCSQHPVFPAPSVSRRETLKARTHRAARMTSCVFIQQSGRTTGSTRRQVDEVTGSATGPWLPQCNDCCAVATAGEHLASALASSCLRRFLATPLYEIIFHEGFETSATRKG